MSIELKRMTPSRAAYFMARFKREEKLLGPNEQAALTYVIDMLEKATTIQQAEAQHPATGEPVAQWQKRHPVRTGGRWISTDEHDAKWWSERATGWEARALYDRPAPRVPDDVVRDAISTVREHYRGTDWGKAAESICDAIDAAMLAAK